MRCPLAQSVSIFCCTRVGGQQRNEDPAWVRWAVEQRKTLSTQTKSKSSVTTQATSSGDRTGAVIGAATVFIGIFGFIGLIWFGMGH